MADNITGTNGNDVLLFEGEITTLSTSITNSYSGQSLLLDDEYNLNTASYEGLAGIDTLFMTNIGDALFLTDNVGNQLLANVERIIAGDGGDAIILDSTTITLGDLFIDGGRSGDVIWGNAGDDTIRGFDGDDILDGGPGNDTMLGQNDDDYVAGGDGNDTLDGGLGADLLLGGNGNDTLRFVGDIIFDGSVLAHNAGSPGITGTGETISASGTNGTFDIFDGGAGFDTLAMTTGSDTLFLTDPDHSFHAMGTELRVIDIEQINAGGGDDIVNLTHATLSYGDVIVNGESGNDTIWTSAGNDRLDGGTGDDNLWGGVGHDTLYGGSGNDILTGGPNAASGAVLITTISHSFTNGVLFPDLEERTNIMDLVPPGTNALGIGAGDLSVSYTTTATVSFVETGAGYNNSLGFYNIAQDGTIQSVRLAFPNVKDFTAGDSATIDLPGAPDTDFGFFVIADGANKNDFSDLDLENSTLSFVYMRNSAHERPATIYDPANKIWLVYSDGTQEVVLKGINGPNGIYHTTMRDGATNLNHDGEVHVVSGIMNGSDGSTLRIGFEDLKHTGDADYNDVVFDLTVAGHSTTTLLVDDSDVLYGGAGNDVIDGGVGDDILFGGTGADTLYGGHGADQFVFDALDGMVDTIKDFAAGDGDILNVTDILEGYDALTDLLSDFVQLVQNGADTELQINADGDAGGAFTAIAIIEGGTGGATLADLIDNGSLVANQSAVV